MIAIITPPESGSFLIPAVFLMLYAYLFSEKAGVTDLVIVSSP